MYCIVTVEAAVPRKTEGKHEVCQASSSPLSANSFYAVPHCSLLSPAVFPMDQHFIFHTPPLPTPSTIHPSLPSSSLCPSEGHPWLGMVSPSTPSLLGSYLGVLVAPGCFRGGEEVLGGWGVGGWVVGHLMTCIRMS